MIKYLVSLSFSVIMLLAGCRVAGSVVVTPTATLTPPPAATATLTPPSDTPLPTPSPTDTPTPTPSQPVFDPDALGDNRELASFIMTDKYKYTYARSGIVDESQSTIEYIKEPFSAYEFKTRNGLQSKTYWIGGRESSNTWYWSIDLAPDPDLLQSSFADMRRNVFYLYLKSARFVGQEDFKGIPANHFEFDKTDLIEYEYMVSGGYEIETAQGDFYVAQDGNYVLYFHAKVTGNVVGSGGGFVSEDYETTQELTSINQLKEIALPADYPALELDLGLSLPLPADTKLATLTHYYETQQDIYYYETSVSNDEFLQFYENPAPTNGWTVSQVGEIVEYEFSCSHCVMLKKGDAKMFLELDDSGLSPWGIVIVGFYYK